MFELCRTVDAAAARGRSSQLEAGLWLVRGSRVREKTPAGSAAPWGSPCAVGRPGSRHRRSWRTAPTAPCGPAICETMRRLRQHAPGILGHPRGGGAVHREDNDSSHLRKSPGCYRQDECLAAACAGRVRPHEIEHRCATRPYWVWAQSRQRPNPQCVTITDFRGSFHRRTW